MENIPELPPLVVIKTIQYQASRKYPSINVGYNVNDGERFVSFGAEEELMQSIEDWLAAGNIPTPAHTAEELGRHAIKQMNIAINNIIIEYTIGTTTHRFSGDLDEQNKIVVALAKTRGNPNKMQNWFTVAATRVQVKAIDLEAILDLIDIEMEIITGEDVT